MVIVIFVRIGKERRDEYFIKWIFFFFFRYVM